MDIQGTSNVAYSLEIKSAQMANNQQEVEGQAVLELLEGAAAPAPVGNVGGNINTFA